MTPYYADPWLTVYHGDARAVMAEMEPESVHCVVTSPPYWGLRDYGEPGQLGLEPTPEAYVESMVAVFREVRRVLRPDGTVWLNLGDTYSAGGRTTTNDPGAGVGHRALRERNGGPRRAPDGGAKPKDLLGIPWRVAFALQADGWYLRSDIIWSKPNPMPESVTDRPTKSHEYVFLLSKSPRYYFDADAVREPMQGEPHAPGNTAAADWRAIRGASVGKGMSGHLAEPDRTWGHPAGRNIRSVWTVATQPYPGAHFATFPPKLIEPCIKAGTSEKGVCPECGAPWVRAVDREASIPRRHSYHGEGVVPRHRGGAGRAGGYYPAASPDAGWLPGCGHGGDPVPAAVLDPFAGSGTTGLVAQAHGRRAVLIDLNGEYLTQAVRRASRSFGVGGPELADDGAAEAPGDGLWG